MEIQYIINKFKNLIRFNTNTVDQINGWMYLLNVYNAESFLTPETTDQKQSQTSAAPHKPETSKNESKPSVAKI